MKSSKQTMPSANPLIQSHFHKSMYDDARVSAEAMGYELPEWEALTEAQREAIAEQNRQYVKEMNDLGNRIAQGNFNGLFTS